MFTSYTGYLHVSILTFRYILSQNAGELCDNLLTCIVRAWNYNKPLFVAPFEDTFMQKNPFIERHSMPIDELGITLISPITQRSASREHGNGAMAEPSTIYSTVRLYYDLKFLKKNVGEVQHLLRIVSMGHVASHCQDQLPWPLDLVLVATLVLAILYSSYMQCDDSCCILLFEGWHSVVSFMSPRVKLEHLFGCSCNL